MPVTGKMKVKRVVSATNFRDHLKRHMKTAKGDAVVLIENRRREAKYLVDKNWLEEVIRERQSILATIEVLADRDLTARLLKTAETIDVDVRTGRLHTMEEVMGDV